VVIRVIATPFMTRALITYRARRSLIFRFCSHVPRSSVCPSITMSHPLFATSHAAEALRSGISRLTTSTPPGLKWISGNASFGMNGGGAVGDSIAGLVTGRDVDGMGSGAVGCAAPTVAREGAPSCVTQPPTMRWNNPAANT
jgi:hypothetical protein